MTTRFSANQYIIVAVVKPNQIRLIKNFADETTAFQICPRAENVELTQHRHSSWPRVERKWYCTTNRFTTAVEMTVTMGSKPLAIIQAGFAQESVFLQSEAFPVRHVFLEQSSSKVYRQQGFKEIAAVN